MAVRGARFRKLTEKLTVPMTPEMAQAVLRAAEKERISAAEVVRRSIDINLALEKGEAA